jgi:Ca2+-binding RTX toxin-like protein
MSDSQFDARYELLSKAISAYSDPQTKSLAEQAFDTLGYKIDRVFDPYSDGGQAIGFSSKDGSKPPVIVFPGGDPGNPRSVGDEEFSTSKQAIQDWIGSITNNQQANPQGFKPDVTGASRGGSLSQLTASEFPTSIGSVVTFVSPGIDRATAAKFTENGGAPSQVRHYVTDGDYRSLIGDAFIPGQVTVGTYETSVVTESGTVDYATRKHGSGILADFSALLPDTSNPTIAQLRAISDKPADLTLSEISVDELNRADFSWQGKDWQVVQEKLQANNPNLTQLIDRQNAEEVRDNLGAGNVLTLIGEAIAGVNPVSSDRVNQPTAGDDILFGTDCNDSISGLAGDDYIRGGAGDDIIFGNEGKDALIGGTGNDILCGGAGNDILTGGAGNDRFVFGDGTASLGIDRINDFTSGEDAIGLSQTIFSLFDRDFAIVTDDASAATSTAAIVYNSSNGSLFYNTNGIDVGFGTGGQFANLFGQPALSVCDFKLI